MTYSNFNASQYSNGISGIFQYLSSVIPAFIPLLFLFIYCVAFMASYFSQLRRTGQGNIPASFTASGFVTFVCGFALSLIPNVVPRISLVVVGALTVVGFIWLMFSDRSG